MKNKYFAYSVRLLLFVIAIFIFTWVVIKSHTPNLPDITFDFSTCQDKTLTCESTIDENLKKTFERNVKESIRSSRRLGKLSDIYISIIRFHLDLSNKSNIKISVPSTKQSINTQTSVNCSNKQLNYGSPIILESNFILSDSSSDLFENIKNFILTCESYYPNDKFSNKKIIVPPLSTVSLDLNPTFSPKLIVDIWSWVIVFIFNLFVIAGTFPVLREICRLIIVKGYKKYLLDNDK